MRLKIQCILMSVILCYSYGCAPKSAKLQKSVVPPDKTLFETGENFLKRGQYIKARLSFQTLINTYPDSEMASEALFATADSYYEEGGTENLLQAEDGYGNFIIFYPASPKASEAQLKIISLNNRMMKGPQNDQLYSHKTLKEIVRFEKQFPDSDYLPIVKKFKIRVQEVLAQQAYLIGKFYGDKGNLVAALSRYQEIPEKYHDYSEMDNVYFQMASIFEKGKKPDEAANLYAKVVQGYPFSKFFEEASARMKSLGKEVPSVDTKLAEVNQKKVKPPVGFVPWKPLFDFANAIVGSRPDVYKEAKKNMDEIAKNREAVATKPGEGEQPAKNSELVAEIAKNSNGDTSVAGSKTDSPPDSPSNEAKKTTTTPRYEKKTAKKNP
jgi:outer membrane protein assembly factor BamD